MYMFDWYWFGIQSSSGNILSSAMDNNGTFEFLWNFCVCLYWEASEGIDEKGWDMQVVGVRVVEDAGGEDEETDDSCWSPLTGA